MTSASKKKNCERKTALQGRLLENRQATRGIAGIAGRDMDRLVGNGMLCWTCYVHRECNTDLETPDVVRAWTDIEKHRICKSPAATGRDGWPCAICIFAALHPRRTSRKITEFSGKMEIR